MPTSVEVVWKGPEVDARIRRAVGRGTLSIGEQIAAMARQLVHVITGTLRRSIHVAKAGSIGGQAATSMNILDRMGAALDVGSWIEYACSEEVGRQHRFMQPAFEGVRGNAITTMKAAFAAEGF